MEFPKGIGESKKNIFLFLEHMLLGQTSATLPLSVEHVLSDLMKVKAGLTLQRSVHISIEHELSLCHRIQFW